MSKQHVKIENCGTRPVRKSRQNAPANKNGGKKETRVDAPHVVGASAAEPVPDTTETANSQSPEHVVDEQPATAERLRSQAAQLGEHLQKRQQNLDRREAQLNALAAQLETDTRAARLWLAEQRNDFDERERELSQKNRLIEESLKESQQSEKTIRRRQEELGAMERRLSEEAKALNESREKFAAQRQRVEDELSYLRQRIDTRRQASLALVRQALAGLERRREQAETQAKQLVKKASQPNKELLAREKKSHELAEEYCRRLHQVIETEESQAAEHAEIGEIRRRLLAEKKELNQREQKRREQVAAEREQFKAELEKKRRSLARRSEELDRAQTALKHLRAELSEMHRDTLELRLATEELWMQLSGTIPPATLTRSLGQIRGQLAGAYRAQKADLAERKQELKSIGDDLAEEHKRLGRRKAELDAWIGRREEEIEQQAARLVAREQELHDQETHFEKLSQQWSAQRLAYQQEIRRLRDQLDTPNTNKILTA